VRQKSSYMQTMPNGELCNVASNHHQPKD
jgi:hypothetical protein